MNNYLSMLALAVLFFCSTCTQKDSAETLVAEVPVKEWAPEDMRDLPQNFAKRGLTVKTEKSTPGYILFHPSLGTSTYLADHDGRIVHEWKGEYNSMLSYLLDDGRIIRADRDPYFPTFAAGGQYGRLREYSWEGEMTWDFAYISEKLLIHHDIAIMPNGNILAIAWESKTKEECIAMGCDPDKLPEDGLWFDKVIEIEPVRPDGGNIVWEWSMWDHLVQNYNKEKLNYGDAGNSPRKFNLNPHLIKPILTEEQVQGGIEAGVMTSNATPDNRGSDITHINAIFYNSDLDQIALSSFYFNEIFIIDHSTTIEEAGGDSGGRYGQGGDLLYRWGNPKNYGRGGPEDQQSFRQHDVRWIPEGYPGAGNLMIFNNDNYGGNGQYRYGFDAVERLHRFNFSLGEVDNYSTVLELELPVDENGNYELPEDEPFGPAKPVWTYTAPDKYTLYSLFTSNAHRLSSGNTFIMEGVTGRCFEVTPEGETVWEYWNPYFEGYRLPDGTLPQPGGPTFFAQFRVAHLSPDHPGLAGRNLIPVDPQPEVFTPPPPPSQEN